MWIELTERTEWFGGRAAGKVGHLKPLVPGRECKSEGENYFFSHSYIREENADTLYLCISLPLNRNLPQEEHSHCERANIAVRSIGSDAISAGKAPTTDFEALWSLLFRC